MQVRTQWIPAPGGGVLGLNYPGVHIALQALQTDVTPDLWSGLQVMEMAALDKLNERDE